MTTIEWTDETWNPTVGCSKTSPGCDNCYAINVAHRAMQPAHAGLTIVRDEQRPDWTGEVRTLPDRLDTPLRWRKPRRVFVDSMSDLFHPDIPAAFVADVWTTMRHCPQHTFQILTKRPQRGPAAVPWHRTEANPLPNVWLGTSIESDRYTFRADHLRATPAAVRFLSLEPLLGPLPSLDLTGIDWVIVGGESGPGARPMHPDWARDIRDRCADFGIPMLFKQWGTWVPYEPDPQPPFWIGQDGQLVDGHHLPVDLNENEPTGGWWAPPSDEEPIYRRVGKKAAGRELDGTTHDDYPAAA